jgi:hypothetical protein
MSDAVIFQGLQAYELSNTRALAAQFEDCVPMSWLPDDGSYSWIPKLEAA